MKHTHTHAAVPHSHVGIIYKYSLVHICHIFSHSVARFSTHEVNDYFVGTSAHVTHMFYCSYTTLASVLLLFLSLSLALALSFCLFLLLIFFSLHFQIQQCKKTIIGEKSRHSIFNLHFGKCLCFSVPRIQCSNKHRIAIASKMKQVHQLSWNFCKIFEIRVWLINSFWLSNRTEENWLSYFLAI